MYIQLYQNTCNTGGWKGEDLRKVVIIMKTKGMVALSVLCQHCYTYMHSFSGRQLGLGFIISKTKGSFQPQIIGEKHCQIS